MYTMRLINLLKCYTRMVLFMAFIICSATTGNSLNKKYKQNEVSTKFIKKSFTHSANGEYVSQSCPIFS